MMTMWRQRAAGRAEREVWARRGTDKADDVYYQMLAEARDIGMTWTEAHEYIRLAGGVQRAAQAY